MSIKLNSVVESVFNPAFSCNNNIICNTEIISVTKIIFINLQDLYSLYKFVY